ncbi:hypothetical protein EVA_22036, partial [gut metagenome]
ELRAYPEYESVRKLAGETGRSFQEIYEDIRAAAARSEENNTKIV